MSYLAITIQDISFNAGKGFVLPVARHPFSQLSHKIVFF